MSFSFVSVECVLKKKKKGAWLYTLMHAYIIAHHYRHAEHR